MERLQKSMSVYVKWLGRRAEPSDDREKGLPVSFLGRTMISHGEEFAPDSEFGNTLISMGRANERVAAMQENFVSDATSTWLESLERSLAMMKEYQVRSAPWHNVVSTLADTLRTIGLPQETREPPPRVRCDHDQGPEGEER